MITRKKLPTGCCVALAAGRSLNVGPFFTRSSAVAVIADRTAYNVRYSCRSLSEIAVFSNQHDCFKLKTAYDPCQQASKFYHIAVFPANFFAER